ncbi:MAG TPA: TIGR00282 family metallophosphoesterase [Opitutaceae bacterium]
MISVLFVGDIVGRPGRDIVTSRIAALRERLQADFVVANAENSAAGAGITGKIARELTAAGVDAITLGDHVWDQKAFDAEIGTLEQLCRPANLPAECPGRDRLVLERGGKRLGVFTVLGRNFMGMKAECPFLASRRIAAELEDKCGAILVEIHMEATSEKIAMGWYLDGRVAAVLGTHTHVPTADARVLPKGTAYLTDVGMTGPYESVLGREIEPVVSRFLDGMPRRFEVATGDVRLSGALVRYDPVAKRAVSCELITER